MAEDDYELLPQKEMKRLKKDVELLKKSPLSTTAEKNDFQNSITGLESSIHVLTDLFKAAHEELKLEEAGTELVEKKIVPMERNS